MNRKENIEIENPYILLTPGPLSTSATVRQTLLKDWCTWDDDYNLGIVTPIRKKLVNLASQKVPENFTVVLMQGSGTFSVEAMIGSVVPNDGKLLILANGAYGDRLAKITKYLNIPHIVHNSSELSHPDIDLLNKELINDKAITHVVVVHCETTTGMLNPIEKIAATVKQHKKIFLLDSMSAFGGIPLDMEELGIDFLVSSANKCIQGVPGFGFIICRKQELEKIPGIARSLSLDLYDQWQGMEKGKGKWRFTSPTHVVRAFYQALIELEEEGGIPVRYKRYLENQTSLVKGIEELGIKSVLPQDLHSPIITSFYNPKEKAYEFKKFYNLLKEKGFVIYPGKVTDIDSFRIGTIGHVFPEDITRLIEAIKESRYWL